MLLELVGMYIGKVVGKTFSTIFSSLRKKRGNKLSVIAIYNDITRVAATSQESNLTIRVLTHQQCKQN